MSRLASVIAVVLSANVLLAAESFVPKRENIEWLDVWVTHGDHPEAAPRVLVIGDSITRAYYSEVAKRLEGKAVCDRLATSASLGDPLLLTQVELVLRQYHYDVVHVNNGMHGWGYTEAEYAAAIVPLFETIHRTAADAKVVWATTTPTAGGAMEKNPRILERNRLVREKLGGLEVVIDDLHGVVTPEMISKDGVHMAAAGTAALAEQVARTVLAALPGGRK